MDLLKIENIEKVFKEFRKNPTASYTSVYNALTNNYNDKTNAKDEFDKYKTEKWEPYSRLFKEGFEPYTACESNPGFFHVKDSGYNDNDKRKHRIYINPSVERRIEFVHALIRECKNDGIKFYFKYSRNEERTDNLLIYASEEQLQEYTKVLKRFETKYPALVKSCSKGPLSATSAGWYSYGPEDKSSEKGSLSSRTAKIVRKNITKMLIENRNLYNAEQIDEEVVDKLYKACIEATASTMEGEERDIFSRSKHSSLERLFKNDISGLASYVLGANINEEQLEKDKPLLMWEDKDGQRLYITPSAISTALAGLKPNFKVDGQREEIYKNLQKGCENDLKEEGLLQPVPEILKNKDLGHEMA